MRGQVNLHRLCGLGLWNDMKSSLRSSVRVEVSLVTRIKKTYCSRDDNELESAEDGRARTHPSVSEPAPPGPSAPPCSHKCHRQKG